MAHKDKLEKKLEELGRAVGCDDSIVDTVMSRIEARSFSESKRVKNEFLVRKIIMNRFTRLAAAAVILIGVLVLFLFSFGPGSIALADVYAKVQQAQAFIWPMSTPRYNKHRPLCTR
jgi:hypothetical protein